MFRNTGANAFAKNQMRLAYEDKRYLYCSTANKSDLEYYKIKAHQVRALSASLAHYNQVPMEQVMDTCSWACHNTFTSIYLQNLSEEMNNVYRIGHIVANQKVVSL